MRAARQSTQPPQASLQALAALGQGLQALRRQPALVLGFSVLSCGTHLLGWALVAAGDGSDSAVLALLLRSIGILLYAGSLLWLIEGLTRIGLTLGAARTVRWRRVSRWPSRSSGDLALGVINTGLALSAAACAGFIGWSLALFLLPGLSAVAALLGLLAIAAAGLSQLFNACLVLDQRLSPSQAFRQGVRLLLRFGPALSRLALLLLALLALPFGLGLVAEALGSAFSAAITVLAMVVVLPVLAATVTAAYRQLPDGAIRAEAR